MFQIIDYHQQAAAAVQLSPGVCTVHAPTCFHAYTSQAASLCLSLLRTAQSLLVYTGTHLRSSLIKIYTVVTPVQDHLGDLCGIYLLNR